MAPQGEFHPDEEQIDYIGDLKKARVLCDQAHQLMQDALTAIEEIHRKDSTNAAARSVKIAFNKIFPGKDSFKEAKMWLGDALGCLGTKLPEEFRDEYHKDIPSQS